MMLLFSSFFFVCERPATSSLYLPAGSLWRVESGIDGITVCNFCAFCLRSPLYFGTIKNGVRVCETELPEPREGEKNNRKKGVLMSVWHTAFRASVIDYISESNSSAVAEHASFAKLNLTDEETCIFLQLETLFIFMERILLRNRQFPCKSSCKSTRANISLGIGLGKETTKYVRKSYPVSRRNTSSMIFHSSCYLFVFNIGQKPPPLPPEHKSSTVQ